MTTEIMGQRARVSSRTGAIAGLLALVGLLVLLGDERRLPGEVRLQLELGARTTAHGWASSTAEFFIGLGAGPIVVLTMVFATWLVWRRFGVRTAALVPAAPVAAVLAEAISKALDEPLPSGHATYAASTFGLLAVLSERAGRRDAVALSLIAIAGMGFSLFVRGRHNLVSIVAGCALGFAWVLILLALEERA
jgi:undecaprenyl-diphosphatase